VGGNPDCSLAIGCEVVMEPGESRYVPLSHCFLGIGSVMGTVSDCTATTTSSKAVLELFVRRLQVGRCRGGGRLAWLRAESEWRALGGSGHPDSLARLRYSPASFGAGRSVGMAILTTRRTSSPATGRRAWRSMRVAQPADARGVCLAEPQASRASLHGRGGTTRSR